MGRPRLEASLDEARIADAIDRYLRGLSGRASARLLGVSQKGFLALLVRRGHQPRKGEVGRPGGDGHRRTRDGRSWGRAWYSKKRDDPDWMSREAARSRDRRYANREAVVYFVRNDLTGNVKIGVTDWLEVRLSTLQIGSDCPLSLVAAFPGAREDEAALHRRFASSRVRGEWFAPTQELLDVVRQVAEGSYHGATTVSGSIPPSEGPEHDGNRT